jgi:hypothetical protein
MVWLRRALWGWRYLGAWIVALYTVDPMRAARYLLWWEARNPKP